MPHCFPYLKTHLACPRPSPRKCSAFLNRDVWPARSWQRIEERSSHPARGSISGSTAVCSICLKASSQRLHHSLPLIDGAPTLDGDPASRCLPVVLPPGKSWLQRAMSAHAGAGPRALSWPSLSHLVPSEAQVPNRGEWVPDSSETSRTPMPSSLPLPHCC